MKKGVLGVRIGIFILIILSFIHPIGLIKASLNPDYFWNLEAVEAEGAWNYTQGRPYITVALIDSGVDFNHSDLINKSWINYDEIPDNGIDDDKNGYIDDINGWDFRDNDNDPSPGHPHGTFISGLIVGSDDDQIGVGIAPNIRLMALRFLNNENRFFANEFPVFEKAIDYAVSNGAQIIHLSIQTIGTPPESFHNAIKRAYDQNVTVVGVTGNLYLGVRSVHFPGNYSEVIAVSATTRENEIASFSCIGNQNEICAPGNDIYSIWPGDDDLHLDSGTSFSAPLVSGTIALMLSLNTNLPTETIREILHETSMDLGEEGKDPIYGYGLLNASAALKKVIDEYNNGSTEPINGSGKTSSSMTSVNKPYFPGISFLLSLFICYSIFKKTRD